MDDAPDSEVATIVASEFQKLKRGPYGLDQALQEAKQADAESIGRIILDESESAWRAYFSVNRATKSSHGFLGKARLAQLLTNLQKGPVEHQRAFARQLALAVANATEPMERAGPMRSAKRRRTCRAQQLNYVSDTIQAPIRVAKSPLLRHSP